MRALIVVESMFGNTRAIADAIAEGLVRAGEVPEFRGEVTVVDVAEAPERVPPDVDLLVVGGPTHAFGLSRPQTRRSAVEQGAEGAAGTGVREWLAPLGHCIPGQYSAAFDTRVKKPLLPGAAAHAIARRLRRLGYRPARPPESFLVDGTPGPLRDGELERARQWGELLVHRLPVRRPAV